MNDQDNRTHQMAIRVHELTTQSINDFAAGSAGRQYYAELQTAITDFEQKAAAHGSGLSEAKQGTRTRGQRRELLEQLLNMIRAVAKALGIEDKFPRSAKDNDDQLLQTADIYAAHALPHKAEFIAHELPADFLEDLAAARAAFQAGISEQANAVGDHISAREELDHSRNNLVAKVRKLGTVYQVLYANNPGKLAEWTAASHVGGPRRKAKTPEPPTPEKSGQQP